MRKILLASLSALLLSACGGDDNLVISPDGTLINLGTSPAGWIAGKGDNNGTIAGFNQKNSFYGTWTSDDKVARYVTAYGDDVTNMPTSGRAEYRGRSIRLDANGNAYDAGESAFGVDFDHKIALGVIDVTNGHDVVMDAAQLSSDGSIRGSAFTVSGISDITNIKDINAFRNGTLHDRGTYRANLHGNGASHVTGVVNFGDVHLNTAFGGAR